MAGNLRRFVLGDVLSPGSREHLTEWMVGCKTGNNGKDASGDIAIAWPKVGGPVLICAYTQGGSPTPPQFEAIFAEVGRMVGRQMGLCPQAGRAVRCCSRRDTSSSARGTRRTASANVMAREVEAAASPLPS